MRAKFSWVRFKNGARLVLAPPPARDLTAENLSDLLLHALHGAAPAAPRLPVHALLRLLSSAKPRRGCRGEQTMFTAPRTPPLADDGRGQRA